MRVAKCQARKSTSSLALLAGTMFSDMLTNEALQVKVDSNLLEAANSDPFLRVKLSVPKPKKGWEGLTSEIPKTASKAFRLLSIAPEAPEVSISLHNFDSKFEWANFKNKFWDKTGRMFLKTERSKIDHLAAFGSLFTPPSSVCQCDLSFCKLRRSRPRNQTLQRAVEVRLKHLYELYRCHNERVQTTSSSYRGRLFGDSEVVFDGIDFSPVALPKSEKWDVKCSENDVQFRYEFRDGEVVVVLGKDSSPRSTNNFKFDKHAFERATYPMPWRGPKMMMGAVIPVQNLVETVKTCFAQNYMKMRNLSKAENATLQIDIPLRDALTFELVDTPIEKENFKFQELVSKWRHLKKFNDGFELPHKCIVL